MALHQNFVCSSVPPPLFFGKFHSVIINFLSGGYLSTVSFDFGKRPRYQGGLAIFDPSTKYLALQLRWIKSLVISKLSGSLVDQNLHHLFFGRFSDTV